MKPLSRTTVLSHLPVLVFLLCNLSGSALALDGPSELSAIIAEAKSLGVPEATLNDLLILGYERRFEPRNMASLIAVLIEAQRASLPLQPMTSKIEEGMLKGVPAPSVEAAVKRRLEDYLTIRSLLDDYLKKHGQPVSIPPEYFVRLAECLYCGLSRDDVKSLLESAPPASIPVVTRGVEVFAALRQLQFDPNFAQQIVVTGMRYGYFASEQQEFARIMAAAKRKGVDEEQITRVTTAGIKDHLEAREISERLGISPQDAGRYGPQMGHGQSGTGRSGGSGRGSASGAGASAGAGAGGGGGGAGAGGGGGGGAGGAGGGGAGGGGAGGGGGSGAGAGGAGS